jgi:hypothetical protein
MLPMRLANKPRSCLDTVVRALATCWESSIPRDGVIVSDQKDR